MPVSIAADLLDRRGQGHDRAHRVRAARRRIAAVERIARTAEVVDRGGIEEHARRVGERGGEVGEARAGGLETLDLRQVEGSRRGSRTRRNGSSADRPARRPCVSIARRSERGTRSRAGSCRCRDGSRKAWSGRDARRRRTSAQAPLRRRSRARVDARHSRPDRPRSRGRSAHRSSLRRQHAPRRDPLVEVGDEEDARARVPERRRRFGDADPVSIGLDDGGAAPGRARRARSRQLSASAPRSIAKTPRSAHGSDGSANRSVLGFRISMPGCKTAARSAPSSAELHGRSLTPLSGPRYATPRFRRARWRRPFRRGTPREIEP